MLIWGDASGFVLTEQKYLPGHSKILNVLGEALPHPEQAHIQVEKTVYVRK